MKKGGPAPTCVLSQEWRGTGPNQPSGNLAATGYKENGSD